MRNETRVLYNDYLERQAQLNSIPNASAKFAVVPSVQQTLENRIQESSEFLSSIHMMGVDELKGEKLGLGVTRTIASRTNTDNGERQTKSVTDVTSTGYECKKTDFDTHIKYATLDAWAKFKDFQARITKAVIERSALDRIMIGFNGITAAADTDIVANPLLQDVNIGWLQHIRAEAPTRVMDEGAAEGSPISVGATGVYKNLDALVYDALNSLLDPWYRKDPKLVAIVGSNLMHDKMFPLVSNYDAPTERLASDIVRSQLRLGGLPGVTVPYFPDGAVLITRLDNLSLYFQNGARRRAVIDNPKKDQIEHYESSNDAYAVEDYGLTALVENITLQA